MPEATITLNTLFEPDDRFRDLVVTAGAEELDETKNRVASLVRGLRWKAIEGELRKKASGLLDTDVMDLMTAAWEKYRVLSDLAEQSASTEEAAFFPLGKHTIHSEIHPYLEVQIGNFSQKITVDVTANIELEGLILKIEKGKITAFESGSCQGSGEIKYKNLLLLQRTFKRIELPGRIDLGNGIAVA